MGGEVKNRKSAPRRPKGQHTPEKPGATAMETRAPDKAGEALANMAADPTQRIEDLAKQMGVPKGVIDGLKRRFRSRYLGLKLELENHTNDEFRDLIEDRLYRVLMYMDDSMIAGASMRDLTHAMDKLMNARQLIRGEPTAIVSVDDRRQMDRLLPLLAQEAKRRGITVDVEGRTIDGEHS